MIKRDEQWELALPQAGFEIFTIVPVDQGVTPLGLVELFNSAGAVVEKGFITPDIYRIKTRGAGRFAVWCSRKPNNVVAHAKNSGQSKTTHLPFSYSPEARWLELGLDGSSQEMVDIAFADK